MLLDNDARKYKILEAIKQKLNKVKPVEKIACSYSRLGSCLFSLPFSDCFSIDIRRHLVQFLTVLKYLAIWKEIPIHRGCWPQKLCKISELRDGRGCSEFSGRSPPTVKTAKGFPLSPFNKKPSSTKLIIQSQFLFRP